jgi:hypothetical protein
VKKSSRPGNSIGDVISLVVAGEGGNAANRLGSALLETTRLILLSKTSAQCMLASGSKSVVKSGKSSCAGMPFI